MNIVVVYNAAAGGEFSKRHVSRIFRQHAITVKQWFALAQGLNGLEEHIKQGGVIAVIGGDGTQSAVAQKLAGTKAVLCPLPGGTLNHFTKDLGVPQGIEEAIANIPKAKMHLVDVGMVNERVFINNSSIGLYPATLGRRDRFEAIIGKWPAAALASIWALIRFRVLKVEVSGQLIRTPFIFVGNNAYKLDVPGGLAKRSRINEGVISLFIAKTSSRLAIIKIAFHAFLGKAHSLDEVTIRQVSSVTIRSRRSKMGVSCDGERLKLTTPIVYQSKPKALRVLY